MHQYSVDSLAGLKNALSDLDSLLIHNKPVARRAKGKGVDAYSKCAADPAAAFSELYLFCFLLGKKGCVFRSISINI